MGREHGCEWEWKEEMTVDEGDGGERGGKGGCKEEQEGMINEMVEKQF